jgi:hypothetical protein
LPPCCGCGCRRCCRCCCCWSNPRRTAPCGMSHLTHDSWNCAGRVCVCVWGGCASVCVCVCVATW